ncbi:hypothetical protein ACHAQH_000278 [Verticillium albo-atrum]
MAEALAAIGLAGNIIAFIDFGGKLVSAYFDIRDRASQNPRERDEMAAVAAHLASQMTTLGGALASSRDPAVSDLLATCLELAGEMREMVRGQQAGARRKGTLSRVKMAAVSIWQREKIADLEKRIGRVRGEVLAHLQTLLFQQQASILSSVSQSREATDHLVRGVDKRLGDLTLQLEKVDDMRLKQQSSSSKEDAQAEFAKFARVYQTWAHSFEEAQVARAIIDSLFFLEIKDRHSEIKLAHRNTFQWIFSPARSNFGQWLASSSEMYWVVGKAGSGKSTLMKFLVEHADVQRGLKQWAGTKRLVTASHFFWSTGTKRQKSLEGLFQTLLLQILGQCPETAPVVCRKRFESRGRHRDGWTISELRECFEALSTMKLPGIRICIFVDGLDEYDGDHKMLAELLETISASEDIKICASSRPWIEFITAFGMTKWQLAVQDLTQKDIWTFITDKLQSHSHFENSIRVSHPKKAKRLVDEIARRASGVFLWVYLVVRSLMRGLDYHDTIEDLQHRLDELPVDLEPYFEHMMDSIESIYRQRTTRVFMVLLQAESTIPVITFHFLDKERGNPDFALGRIESLDSLAVAEKQKSHQLIAQCRDLVQVTESPDEQAPFTAKVGFLHRTVTDYLRTQRMKARLGEYAGQDYDARVSLCRSGLAQVKVRLVQHPENNRPRLVHEMAAVLRYARQLEVSHGRPETSTLRELDQEVTSKYTPGWKALVGVVDCTSFVCLAMRCGLHLYCRQIQLQDASVTAELLLLQSLKQPISTEVDSEFKLSPYEDLDLSNVEDLLKAGASPNEAPAGCPTTAWGDFVWRFQYSTARSTALAWDMNKFLEADDDGTHVVPAAVAFKVCSLMVSNGAAGRVLMEMTEEEKARLVRFSGAIISEGIADADELNHEIILINFFREVFSVSEVAVLERHLLAWESEWYEAARKRQFGSTLTRLEQEYFNQLQARIMKREAEVEKKAREGKSGGFSWLWGAFGRSSAA